MKSLDDQPTLWEDDRREALNVLEQSRQQWMLVRRTQAIGTADEEEAWKHYRSASDRYWNVVHRT